MNFCEFLPVSNGPVRVLRCVVCAYQTIPVTNAPADLRRVCGPRSPTLPARVPSENRTDAEIEELAKICINCPGQHFHRHERAGARCTHKGCRCHGPELTPLTIAGEVLSAQLVNQLRSRPSCPAGCW